MSKEELDTLRAEAAPVAEEPVAEVPSAEVLPPVGLQTALTQVVAGLSVPVCRRAKVTGLEAAEAEAIGSALALLVTVYDVGPKDPKAAAWLGLGLSVVGVVANRRPLPQVEEGPRPDAPPAPDFGSTGTHSLGPVA